MGNLDFGCKEEDCEHSLKELCGERGPPGVHDGVGDVEPVKRRGWVTMVGLCEIKKLSLAKFAARVFLQLNLNLSLKTLCIHDRERVDEV